MAGATYLIECIGCIAFGGDFGALAFMVCGAQLIATICYALVKMYNAKGEAQNI